MKFKTVLALVVFSISCQCYAQKHICLGLGFSTYFYDSKELELFKDTYHTAYLENLSKYFDSFNGGEGMKFELSYRQAYKRTYATTFGWQFYKRRNNTIFGNDEKRIIDLKTNFFFVENELGRPFGPGYINGLLVLNVGRKSKIESDYVDRNGARITKRLNGTYKTNTILSGDLGLSYWLVGKPFFVIFRATYPVFATNKSKKFRDNSPEKVTDESEFFPDNYVSYWQRQPYEGIPNKLDGLKLSITLQYGFEIFSPKNKENEKPAKQ